MNPDDKPPPYSEVSPPGQEYHPQMPGPTPPVMQQPGPHHHPDPHQHQHHHHHQHQHHQYPPAGSERVPLAGAAATAGYGSTVTYVTTVPAHEVIIVGGCPACRIGVLEDDFSCLGIFCAIFFFPLGILCCLATRQRRCPNCGAIFG